VPVAGLGTRLLPATRSAPKEMLPVVDKPVVQYVIEELAAAGVRRVLFVTGRRKRAIEDHFDTDPELERATGDTDVPGNGLRLLYTRQPHPRGLGDAVRCGEDFADGRPVVVALGDAIIEPPSGDRPGIVSRLIEAHRRHGAAATLAVTEVPDEAVRRYGIVVARPGGEDGALVVDDVVEKPDPAVVPSRTAIAARYVLGPEVFAALAETEPGADGELGLTEALAHVIAGGGRVIAVPLAPGEKRHDIGTVAGYCRVFLDHALRHPEFGAALRAHAARILDDA
jgi:UTP--glucose-1-phosphate uridylyltransferase